MYKLWLAQLTPYRLDCGVAPSSEAGGDLVTDCSQTAVCRLSCLADLVRALG